MCYFYRWICTKNEESQFSDKSHHFQARYFKDFSWKCLDNQTMILNENAQRKKLFDTGIFFLKRAEEVKQNNFFLFESSFENFFFSKIQNDPLQFSTDSGRFGFFSLYVRSGNFVRWLTLKIRIRKTKLPFTALPNQMVTVKLFANQHEPAVSVCVLDKLWFCNRFGCSEMFSFFAVKKRSRGCK